MATPIRTIRVADPLWDAASEIAGDREENVSELVRAALARYVRRHGSPDQIEAIREA